MILSSLSLADTLMTLMVFSATETLAGLLNVGAVFAFTVTLMVCVASNPSGSAAVTVIVAVPADTGAMVMLEPEALVVATEAALDDAV